MTVKDLPDNYPWLPGSERYPIADLGELAARLGALHVFDRRGEVLFQTDMGHGLAPFTTYVNGTGASVTVQADETYLGPYCIKLKGGSDGLKMARVFLYSTPVKEGLWGVETSIDFGSDVESLEIRILYYDGTNQYDAAVKIVTADLSVQIEDNVGGWVSVGTFGFFGSSGAAFHTVKLVADFENKTYTRVIIGQREFDISAYDLLVTGAPGEYNVVHRITLVSDAAKNAEVRLGHILVTANEP